MSKKWPFGEFRTEDRTAAIAEAKEMHQVLQGYVVVIQVTNRAHTGDLVDKYIVLRYENSREYWHSKPVSRALSWGVIHTIGR